MSQSCQRPKRMLLCIDDSPEIVEYERRILEQSGYLVVTATSVRRGLALATMCSFDAVLLDYQMPEMNGHELAHQIRRLRPGTPVIMFSGARFQRKPANWSMLSCPKQKPAGNWSRQSLDSVIR